MIPLRNQGVGAQVKGRCRRRLRREFDERPYHQRAKVETILSLEKLKMGSTVLARVSRL